MISNSRAAAKLSTTSIFLTGAKVKYYLDIIPNRQTKQERYEPPIQHTTTHAPETTDMDEQQLWAKQTKQQTRTNKHEHGKQQQ